MFTSIMRSHSSTLSRSSGAWGIRPTLLIITPTRTEVVTAASTRALTCSRSVTSVVIAIALPPFPVSSPARASRCLVRRAPSTILAPAAERRRAVASPNPLLAPVMTTILSLIPSLMDSGLSQWLARSESAAILLVTDLFHPIDVFAVEPFGNSDMRHRGRRRRAVPVLLTRRKPDDIAGTDFLDRSVLALNPAKAGRDDEGLTERMGMPHGAGARLEGDLTATEARGVTYLKHRVHANSPGKPGVWTLAGRPGAVAFDIHRLLPFCCVIHGRCF